ncbi:hypothetical protein Vadar_010018 [Vaccinium darrowii]|uniref:Uncharacterized protein n=1 Tax=Vaccinium darrowii TaxID=229202 RepID=A0ACB7XPP5_9ERIC|nr:hypothetical protein Vadar_010018 [Vaccinium darrowii]
MAMRGANRTSPPPPRKRRATAAAATIIELPDDIICNILARIPDIKSLVKCKRVCKTWRNLILQPYFAKSHLSRGSFPLSLILYRPSDAPTNPAHFGILELSDDLASLSHQNATIKFRSGICIPRDGQRGRVIGACNGLLCLRVDNDIVVCNPILPGRHYVLPKLPKLAQPRQSDLRFGFGFSPLSDEYKVLTCTLGLENHLSHITLDIFTLGRDDTWRSIEGHYRQQSRHYCAGDDFVFVNGALHWLGWDMASKFLCYFDVENEELGNVSLPSYIGVVSYLGVLDDFLYLGDIHSLKYAYTLQVDEKSDIYSFGVVLMEIVTGKRSVDSEFGEGNSIVDWLRTKIKAKHRLTDVLDKNVFLTVVF